MNRVKVFFRPTYRKYFKTVLFPILNDQEKFMKTIGLRTNSQFNACLIEMRRNIACLLYLETLILTLGQPFYYNTYFRDRRGRIYTNLTHFRHIGPK